MQISVMMILILALLFVPISIVLIITRARTRQNEEVHKTILAMIEQGQMPTPEVLDHLAGRGSSTRQEKREQDRRNGMQFLGVGLAMAIIGWSAWLNSESSTTGYLAMAVVFTMFGLTKLWFWKYSGRNTHRRRKNCSAIYSETSMYRRLLAALPLM